MPLLKLNFVYKWCGIQAMQTKSINFTSIGNKQIHICQVKSNRPWDTVVLEQSSSHNQSSTDSTEHSCVLLAMHIIL